ncbi:helix-turn-helix domain-containing protein [Parasphingorhabdus halotolerans]|uniref:AraC family transcriptional regulator n=1 Tax=Parasphingorhabdus halotolerans TaxID=2725558 RepID=A0A6H2DLH6_9SPHN|nr:helix-turn-helix domain-containing protein [Parasphingorhabdus halotolerans]QJB69240.1 AraC family transcriptional regulator [Parasphingorhabdus halotolerans]
MELNIDTIIRLMSVGASALLLLLIIAGRVRRTLKLPLIGLALGGATYLINTSTTLRVPHSLEAIVDLISIVTPFWTWLFARRLFEKDPPKGWLALLGIAYIIGWILARWGDSLFLVGFYIVHILSLILIVDLIYNALSGLKDDLVQKRRLIRIYLPLLVGLQAAGILTYELVTSNAVPPPAVQITNASLVFALVMFGGLALLVTDPSLLVETDDDKKETKPENNLSPIETVLQEKLNAAMLEGEYRTAGLTIQSLAAHLNTPEHRLRALINQKLGHRNFSSFLNGYRIAEAKEKLADRELVDLPILTIAMDLGYNSLAPFNRAFRAETSVTPSDFRKSAIDQN